MAFPVRFPSLGRQGEFQLTPGPVLRLSDPESIVGLLRGALSEPGMLDAFRRALGREGGDVSRWTEAEVLVRIAKLVADGRWHLAHLPGTDRRFLPGLANRRPEPRAAEPRERRSMVPDQETYVLAVEIKTIGGTLLANHPVRVLDPDTGDIVVDEIDTDSKGVVRTRVPEDKTYRIEILDEVWEMPDHAFHSDDTLAVLACRFVDAHDTPIADTLVEVRCEDREFELCTDADGRIEAPAAPGPHELRLRGEVFHAHTVLPGDVEAGDADEAESDDQAEAHYVFVVAAAEEEPTEDQAGSEDDHRLVRESWFDGLDQDDRAEPLGEVA